MDVTTDGLGLAVTAVGNANGTWQYSTDGTSWTNIPVGTSATAALLLNPTDRIRFAPNANVNGDPGATLTLTLWHRTSNATDTTADDPITTDGDRYKGDNDQFSGTTVVLKASITPVNDAPVNTVPGTLTGIVEDTVFTFDGTNRFNVTDIDVNENPTVADRTMTVTLTAQHGVLTLGDAAARAAVSFGTGDGVSDATVTATGTLAQLQALFASVTYKGNANFNGADSVTITTNDRGNYGTGGVLQDVDTVNFTVAAVNDAPTAPSTAAITLTPVAEDVTDAANSGSTVSDLFATGMSDAADAVTGGTSANGFQGIAIVSVTQTAANGRWQYQIGGTGAWIDVGDRGLANALVLGATDRLRFQPATDYNGPAPDLAVRLIEDGGTPPSSGAVVDLSSGTVTGGDTRYSDVSNQITLQSSVTAVNDRPVVTGSGAVTLIVPEDASPAGATVTSLLASRYSDATDDQSAKGGSADATALSYVAVVSNAAVAGQGVWQYSADGTSWTDIPTSGLSASSALVLSASTQLRFLPAADFHGTPGALTLRMADGSANPVTTSAWVADLKDLSTDGGTDATGRWSLDSIALQPTVTSVNDAPTATGSATLAAISEDTTPGAIPGATVASLFGGLYGDAVDDQSGVAGGTDAHTTMGGVAIVGDAATATQGAWYYSANGGTDWTALPSGLSDSNALILPILALLRFVPAADWNGTPGGLTARLSDQTVANAAIGQTLDIGGTNHWSATTVTLGTSVTAVEDAIEAVNDTNLIHEDDTAPATGNVLANDVDRDSLGSIDPQTLYVTAIQGATAPAATTIDTAANNAVTVQGRYGSLTIHRDGSYSYAIDNSLSVIQQLKQGQTLADEVFTYTVDDVRASDGVNVGSPAVQRTLSITITGVNDVPVAVADTGAIQEDATAPATGNVLTNDTEIDANDPGTVSAVSFAGTAGTVGQALAGRYGTLTMAADGSWSYAVDNGNAAVQALAVGETLTETLGYTVKDTANATSTTTLSITITGTNDAPSIALQDSVGAVTEDAGSPTLSDSGTIAFTDVDLSNTHTVAVGAPTVTTSTGVPSGFAPAAGFGTLTASVAEDATDLSGTGQVHWTFAVDNGAVQGLAAGETVTQVYTLTLKDSDGATVTRDVTVTITGTNDVPSIALQDSVGAVTEDAGSPTLSDSGTIAFTDVDLSDVHSATAAFTKTTGTTQLGSLTAVVGPDSTGSGTGGTVTWTYTVDNAGVQFLAVDQTVTETYTVTMADGKGGTVTRDLAVTITGTNDAPAIGTARLTGAVTEDANAGTLTDRGTMAFSDVDLTDAHSVSSSFVSTSGAAPLGSLTAVRTADSTGAGTGGVVTWTYTVDNAAVQSLRQGETVTETYAVTVSDGHGGTMTRDVVVTITGTNDAPTVTGDPPTAAGNAGQAMTLTVERTRFADLDQGDTLAFTATLADGGPLPSWLAFDPATLTFSGTPPQTAAGTLSVALHAIDGAGASVSLGSVFTITAAVEHTDTSPTTPPTDSGTPLTTVTPTATTGDTLITAPTNPAATTGTGSGITGGTGLTTAFQGATLTPIQTTDSGGFGSGAASAASRLTLDAQGALSMADIFRQTGQANVDLFLTGNAANQTVQQQQQASFQVPKNIFRHSNPNERLSYQATRPDGSPIPDWLHFESNNLAFRGVPPADARGALDIVIVAKDARGNQAAAQFRILITQDNRQQGPIGDGRGNQDTATGPQGNAQGNAQPGGTPDVSGPSSTAPREDATRPTLTVPQDQNAPGQNGPEQGAPDRATPDQRADAAPPPLHGRGRRLDDGGGPSVPGSRLLHRPASCGRPTRAAGRGAGSARPSAAVQRRRPQCRLTAIAPLRPSHLARTVSLKVRSSE